MVLHRCDRRGAEDLADIVRQTFLPHRRSGEAFIVGGTGALLQFVTEARIRNDRRKTTVSLVLGSGGARGLAHIGIIKWLEEHGYEIRSIAGCSIGALIGGIYACGKLDTYTEWVRAIDEFDIVRLLDLSWGKAGLFDGEKIIAR